MQRTTLYVTHPPFVVDPSSLVRTGGRQVDWDSIPESYREGAVNVTVGTGGAAAGATSVPVVALPVKLDVDMILKFGSYAPVTVTVNDSSVSAGDTGITI